ncbi:hypothetical protein COT48_00745 [Candidatus Woesearchaeota archaeon CG08_land_8_20_14_0_20_47_9]|nr:MAG: hypothetical protein AUJ69_02550 [Candidatus Woesearchaeota archaeon CG1_02_47_18]PIN72342.1 MAG: hypothetical protein COV22_03475 [Candidatus Woesearchaeota archaeon CG10_big_fil_rev_8_21_14_0_10_47_5]PIO04375.1 MAG: hypothetical protein COT48_00745 [Candidatus Woesearchaeota archaeon CG08_land_8_20_14_0_20_47_9]HII29824.1 hypothetical protein [Candidatus Woesearchaeota archaeon]
MPAKSRKKRVRSLAASGLNKEVLHELAHPTPEATETKGPENITGNTKQSYALISFAIIGIIAAGLITTLVKTPSQSQEIYGHATDCTPGIAKHHYCEWTNNRCLPNPDEYLVCRDLIALGCTSAKSYADCVGSNSMLFCEVKTGCS